MAVLSIEYIVSTPDVFGWEPHIAGKRIRVRDIAMWHKNGATVEKIVQQFDATIAEAHAALSYYYDNITLNICSTVSRSRETDDQVHEMPTLEYPGAHVLERLSNVALSY